MSKQEYGRSFQHYENYFECSEHASNPEHFNYAIVKFFHRGIEPEFDNEMDKFLWKMIRPSIACSRRQSDRGQGAPLGSRNNPNGRRGITNPRTNPRTNPQTKQIEIEKEIEDSLFMEDAEAGASTPQHTKKFVKPTLREVQQYCASRHNSIDAAKFIDHYDSVGWKIGKAAMKDWKAAVRNWERNQQDNNPGQPTPPRREARPLSKEDLV